LLNLKSMPRKGDKGDEVKMIQEEDKLKDIEGELNKASKMHKSQADRIGKIVKEGGYKMKKSDLKEFIKSTLNEDEKEDILKQIEKLRVASNAGEIDGDEFLSKFNPLQKKLKALNEDDINESVNDKTLNKIFKFFSRDLYGELKLDMGQAKKLTYEIEKLINKGL